MSFIFRYQWNTYNHMKIERSVYIRWPDKKYSFFFNNVSPLSRPTYLTLFLFAINIFTIPIQHYGIQHFRDHNGTDWQVDFEMREAIVWKSDTAPSASITVEHIVYCRCIDAVSSLLILKQWTSHESYTFKVYPCSYRCIYIFLCLFTLFYLLVWNTCLIVLFFFCCPCFVCVTVLCH